MARQKTSPIEDMVMVVSKLPWWAGLTLALVSYLVLHAMASRPVMPTTVTPGQMGDAVSKGLVTTMAMFGQQQRGKGSRLQIPFFSRQIHRQRHIPINLPP